ncbi:MAG: hypothetical protein ACJ8R9_27170 [Steroidobacteraceae bacterium]
MQCAELMETKVATMGPEDPAHAASRTMADRGVGFISDRWSGVISLSDLGQLGSGRCAARMLREVSGREARP